MTNHVSSLKNESTGFYIILVYVDDLSIIGNEVDMNEAQHHLKIEFEMKDLGHTKFCLGLQLEHFHSGIFMPKLPMSKRYWRNSIWTSHIHQNLDGRETYRY